MRISRLSGRSLTSGKIILVQSVFGNNIDLTKVRVFNGCLNLFHENFAAGSIIAPDGNIYWPNIGHPSVRIHKQVPDIDLV